jgi:toxin ParE1/3/4
LIKKYTIRSEESQAQFEDALAYYEHVAPHMVDKFLRAAERATEHMERFPDTGSPRYAHELGIDTLRFWRLAKFPYAWFYTQDESSLYVVAFVHLESDIPASLQSDT